jgi:probable HAF family extracellular repeat protein
LIGLAAAAPVFCSTFYTITDLGTLGGTTSFGFGINSSGNVAGSSTLPGDADPHAFLWNGTLMQDLGTLGGSYSFGYGINSAGNVTGESGLTGNSASHAFLWNGTSMQDLGTLGGSYSLGYAINSAGNVTGYSTLTGSSDYRAFLWNGTSMQDLGTLGGTDSFGYGINSLGNVVGSSYLTGNFVEHAFLWDGTTILDLNGFVTNIGGWELIEADGINDSGQITGSGSIGGQRHAYLLTPVADTPEPSTWALAALGLGLCAWRARSSSPRVAQPGSDLRS